MDEAQLDDAIGTVNIFRHKLEKYVRLDEQDKIKSYLRKLQHYPITLEILQETGVGKTVNGLRKYGGSIGDKAKLLVNKWKTLVVVDEDDGPEHEDEPEPEVPGNHGAESPEPAHEPEPKPEPEEEGGMEIDEAAVEEHEPREDTPPPPTPPREPSPVDIKPFNGRPDESDSGEEAPKSEPSSPVSSDKKVKKRKKKSKDKDKEKLKEKDKKKEKDKHRESKEEKKKRKLDKSPELKSSEKNPPPGKSERKLVECDIFASSSAPPKSPLRKKHKPDKPEKAAKANQTEREIKSEKIENVDPPKPALLPKLEEMLPEISPDYTPSSKRLPPLPSVVDSPTSSNSSPIMTNGSSKKGIPPHMTEYEALSWTLSNKAKKTKVYSGAKSGAISGDVPKLEALCVKLLGDNVKDLHKMPAVYGMPFEIVRLVLYRCNAEQLLFLEEMNPIWIEDTGKHWELLVKKDFKTEKRQECEEWREMYLRCKDEREAKFKRLTASISRNANTEKSALKKTKMAYVDVPTKPAHRRVQVTSGSGSGSGSSTSRDSKVDMAGSAKRASILQNAVGPGNEATVSVPTGVRSASSNGGGSSGRPSNNPGGPPKKPKVAPLMHKTLQQMKRRFR